MTPRERIASYRASIEQERDHQSLAIYARGHHLAEAQEAEKRGDAPTVAHHRGMAVMLAKVVAAARVRIAWYREAITALEAEMEPPAFSAHPAHYDEAGDDLGMRVGG